jgi:hypothetical protein
MLSAPVRIFSFDAAQYRDRYAAQGWIHVRGGIDPAFLVYLSDFARTRGDSTHVEGLGIGGSKSQSVFEFSSEVDFPDELFDVVAEVAGCRREGLTLSERHLKTYNADAPPDPRPHKDRLSSLVSVGLSIDIPPGSCIELYPRDDVWVNPHNVAGNLLSALPDERQPEVTLAGKRPVRIADTAGDVVMFPGSAVWHLRRNSANAKNLYLKFNDFGSDPLGEDPMTDLMRARTLAALDGGGIGSLTAVLARRFDVIRRLATRVAEVKVLEADVWDSPPVALSEPEAEMLEGLGRGRAVAELDESSVRRLARSGVIDLI